MLTGARSKTMIFRLLAHQHYALVFSVAYAIFNALSFYPGILYSDSSPRWLLAIDLVKHGLDALPLYSNQYPVLPSFLLSGFYALTNEIGFFIFVQSVAFALSLFVFVHTLKRCALTNVLVSVALLMPINQVYALFHSYDSVAAILLMFLSASLLKLIRGDNRQYYYLSLLFFALAAFRLNAVALLLPAAVVVAVLTHRRGHSWIRAGAYMLVLWALVGTPLFVKWILPMKPSNSWVTGIAWEYVNMAAKSGEQSHLDFLSQHGVDVKRAATEGCYHSIYCDEQGAHLIRVVRNDTRKSRVVARQYIALALDHPRLFLREKTRYLLDLYGYYRPISNAEIGKWRQNQGEWLERFAKLGFHPNAAKERFIDRYFAFVRSFEVLTLRPWIEFTGVLALLVGLMIFRQRQLAISLAIALLLSVGYYATFTLTTGSHELRYFFPSWFVMQGICLVVASKLLATGPWFRTHQ